jgi:N-acetylglutamate synthase-like GNAT family acetyltransferase
LIRAARADEAEAVVALIQRAFGEYRGKLRPESGALLETPETLKAAMKTGTILLAERAGRILGCVSVRRKDDCAYAGRLAVEPMERGIGVGRALLTAAEAVARQMGTDRLRVDVRLKLRDNRAFFRALGFVEGAERCHPGFSTPTYVELEKTLI